MKIEEMIEVMEHYRRGGKVEYLYIRDEAHGGEWRYPANVTWDWENTSWRIHPEEQAIIDHFNNGGEVQFDSEVRGDWAKWTGVEKFQWNVFKYRIKPKEDEHKCIKDPQFGICPKCYELGKDITKDYTSYEKWSMDRPKEIEVPLKCLSGEDWSDYKQKITNNDILTCLNKIVERLG